MARRPLLSAKQQLRHRARLLVAMLLLVSSVPWWTPSPAFAQPLEGAPIEVPVQLRSGTASLTVTIAKSAPAIAPTGTAQITVTAGLRIPVRSLTVRVRIRRPSGRLLYQRTQTLTRLRAGTTVVQFTKSFSDLALKEGRYPIEAAITASSLPPLTLTDRLYLVKRGRPPVSLVIVPRFNYSPMIDPEGRFVIDPATATRARDEVTALTGLLDRSPSLRLSLGVPPLMLDEWRRITSGYKVVGPDGVRTVAKSAPVATAYAVALQALRAASAGRLELLDVPFADPDLDGLRSIGALSDLKRHYDRALSIYQASLGATPVAGTAVLGDSVPNATVPVLTAERLGFVLLRPSALTASRAATAASGVYVVNGTRLKCLVIDEQAAAILEDPAAKPEQLLDHLFSRLTSDTAGSQPVVVTVPVGPGAKTGAATLETMLAEIGRTGWVRFVSASQAARTKPLSAARLPTKAPAGAPAPQGYWAEVARARQYAVAFVDAVSEKDPDAEASMYTSLVAESRCWAGPDQSWSFADRGRAFASAAQRSAAAVLSQVSVASQNITLASSSGKVPLSIKNSSGKTLNVVLVAQGSHALFPGGSRIKVALRPADNYVTFPVDLGTGGFTDRLTVSVMSGDLALAKTSIDVRASYTDRLALVSMVVVVMLGLLFYIRRKVRSTEADT